MIRSPSIISAQSSCFGGRLARQRLRRGNSRRRGRLSHVELSETFLHSISMQTEEIIGALQTAQNRSEESDRRVEEILSKRSFLAQITFTELIPSS